MEGAVVKSIQTALKAAGFHPGKLDGVFGLKTHAAVVAFQLRKGLIADGEVGPLTAKELRITLP
ncbi:MAG: peptidoglycan-binding protein [Ignavibacteriae bacterium]|nr:peptidoglycan-binding protein [Ignavibacteriota bacterium]